MNLRKIIQIILMIIIGSFPSYSFANYDSFEELYEQYEKHCNTKSDINEHLPVLRKLAKQCESAVEIGVRSMVSTWGILQGLAESPYPNRIYLGIDLHYPNIQSLSLASKLSTGNSIIFCFWQENDMDIDIPETDLLFIDSLHTYCHLTYELEKFSGSVKKYIALHDTSYPWELQDDITYTGNYSEYPESIDKTKRGLWPAVQDFLKRHPEWTLYTRLFNNHGFTILKRNQ